MGGWILAPLALAVVCVGLGLLAERVSGATVPALMLPGLGLGTLVVVAGVPVALGGSAPAAVPLCVALAVAGFVVRRRDVREPREWRLPVLTGLAVYVIYAAPSVLSGQGLITGWIKLDDSAIWIAIAEHVLGNGPEPPAGASSHDLTLRSWLNTGYPYGTFLPLGLAGKVTGQDLVNVYSPVIAFCAAVLALSVTACVREVLGHARAAAAVGIVSVQASLLFGYAQWGGLKEIVTATLLATGVWFAARGARGSLACAALLAGALAGGLGAAAAPYVAPLAAVAAFTAWRSRPARAELGLLVGVLVLAAIPVVASLEFLEQTVDNSGVDQDALGNLVSPLSVLQGIGLWPQDDFRVVPAVSRAAEPLAILGAATAAAACALTVMRGRPLLAVMVGVAVVGSAAGFVVGGPWIDAKALTIASVFVFAASATAVALAALDDAPGVRTLGVVGAVVLVAATAWSTASIARSVNVAPRDQLAELRDIGDELSGLGPTLQTNFNIYGDRWFLRDADADGATDLRTRSVRDLTGNVFPEQSAVELDEVTPSDLDPYRAIVRRRSPVSSQPTTGFARLRAGRWWESWVRVPGSRRALGHLGLGDALNPVAVPDCTRVRALAKLPDASRLLAVPRSAPVVRAIQGGGVPPAWIDPANGATRPVSDSVALVTVDVPRAGEWRLWVGGSVYGQLDVYVDNRKVGSARHELSYDGEWLRFGSLRLTAGVHAIALDHRRGWHTGRHQPEDGSPLGPIALTETRDDRPIKPVEVARADYRQLCSGATYDWVEATG